MSGSPWIADILHSYQGDDRLMHTYVDDSGHARTLSRSGLRDLVAGRAGALAQRGVKAGDRVALVAGEPEDFAPTFLALLWLGAIAVPLPPLPPLGRRDEWRANTAGALRTVRAQFVCGPAKSLAALEDVAIEDVGLEDVAIEDVGLEDVAIEDVAIEELVGAEPLAEPALLPPDAVAYAQFTSGSTGRPRAVLVTRSSLAANCAALEAALDVDDRDVGVTWLPLHHDMGLVIFVCTGVSAGARVVFLPTSRFIRDPGAWMRTCSEYRASISVGPTFGYGLAAKRARPQDIAALDLSGLRVLGCGAEPIHAPTLERFAAAYAPAGLDPATFAPSYGLAEATLVVSVARGLRHNQDIVECGLPVLGQEVAIMDDAGARCPDGAVGEIWVRGPSVAAGYFDEPAPETFRPDGWLRTGDLGYLVDGSLYVTGRRKDVLIVRGVNTDPQRVEWAAAAAPGVREAGVVAFTRPGPDTEEIVVVVECAPNAPDGVEDAVRQAVVEPLGLVVVDVVRVKPGTLPRTTSGKPRRQETRRRYLAGELARR